MNQSALWIEVGLIVFLAGNALMGLWRGRLHVVFKFLALGVSLWLVCPIWTMAGRERPATAASVSPSVLESRMMAMINDERGRHGLTRLKWDGALASVGRRHARDMQARRYFAHEDPSGRTPGDRVGAAGVPFTRLGENLAFAPDLKTAHRGLMESPGHRENILNPAFSRLGIGIVVLPAGTTYLPPKQQPSGSPRPLPGSYLLVTQLFAR